MLLIMSLLWAYSIYAQIRSITRISSVQEVTNQLRLQSVSAKASAFEDFPESKRIAVNIHNLLCKNDDVSGLNITKQEKEMQIDWNTLCSEYFVISATRQLLQGHDVNVVQIGAHIGFEMNDPIAQGLSRLLDEVEAAAVKDAARNETRQRFHWTFVEPSPPNFKRLTENLLNHSTLCDMKGINVGVVSDDFTDLSEMLFYSVRDTIDPESGYDSLSGKTFPFWITQVSSFSKTPLHNCEFVFNRLGLQLKDYIVETKVTTKSYSNLMQEALARSGGKKEEPLLVLIDTEGLDCDIIKGIHTDSPYLPRYLVFEHKQCEDREGAYEHLKKLGYKLYTTAYENAVAVKIQ